jgi:hypothetical protein
MTALQILDIIAVQFINDPNKETYIQLATLRTSQDYFGDNYQYAIALRSAHMLETNSNAQSGIGGGGIITSEREGDLAVSYGSTGSIYNRYPDLATTSYGRQLVDLIMGSGLPITVVNL